MAAITAGEDRVRLLYRMRARQLFWRMLEHQGVNPALPWWHGLDAMIDRAVRRCGECKHSAACSEWLNHPPADATLPGFCPNEDTMAAARIAGTDTAGEPSDGQDATVRELLEDPIIAALMAADRVNCEILRHALLGPRHFTAAYAAPQQLPCRGRSAK